jgi:hypothetical protein
MGARSLTTMLALLLVLPVISRAGDEKDKVYRKISAQVLEDVLGKLDVRFKKATPNNGPTVYDFDRNGYKIRLSSFGGLDLMLEAAFDPVTTERINAWNIRAKFSRGVLYPGNGKPYAAIETNLDCEGGVTPGTITQFIRRFDNEVSTFDKFVAERGSAPAPAALSQTETIYPGVSTELLENVLKDLKITYRKTALKNGAGFSYDYERQNVPVRLVDFGGKDLMLSAQFRKATLPEINQYNLKRNFIRAVLYKDANRAYTALERSLDAEGGVTENMMRNFITSYHADMDDFQRFLGQTEEKSERGTTP